jgi:hypothetical protein
MKTRFLAKLPLICAGLLAGALTVNAQATRTWVSGVGDDVNPCSRTAPCKTFAGAISKTAEGGEIDALDPGGYGTLTISKAMTVDGTTGSGWASVLNTGGISGFNVNITTGNHVNDAVVILRNITIQGASQAPNLGGLRGINITKVNRIFVYNCHIENQTSTGITQNVTTSTNLFVRDCDFSNVGTGISSTAAGGTLVVQADNINVQGCTSGMVLTGPLVFGFITNSTLSANVGGNAAQAGNGCTLNVTHTHFHANNTAINAIAGSTVRVNDCEFFDNGNALAGNASSFQSGGNNKLSNNSATVTPTGPALVTQ